MNNNIDLNHASINILVIDDTPNNLRILSVTLTKQGYQVHCAKDGATGIVIAQNESPDLILLDIIMPDMDGYRVCEQLKSNSSTSDIPVIFISALDDAFDKVKAFAVGGVDFITKPFHLEEVLARINNQLVLQVAKAKIVQLNIELEQKVQYRTAQLEEVIHQLHQEVAEHKVTQAAILQRSFHDEMTGLPNRSFFLQQLQKSLDCSRTSPNYLFAVLFIDLDRFKIINDSWGHGVGDQLLIAFANILKTCTRSKDTVARLSGDEFTILLEDIHDFQDAIAMAERLLHRLTSPIHLDQRRVFSGASIGIVFGTDDYQNVTDLLRDADIAMYRAKTLGKGQYAIFNAEMYAQVRYLSQIETDLRDADSRQEFVLHYQPIVSLTTDQVTGFEALLRWQHPERGLIYPADFIAIAEDTGLIVAIGEWVLQEACQQLRIWQDLVPGAVNLEISVNLSGRQIQQSDFADRLAQTLGSSGLDGRSLRLELTETMLMEKGEKTIEFLAGIKAQNAQLSIDDFGTGYSSLSYLHRFPIDALKIDRSFVNLITPEGKNDEIVKTIITLAHSLGMKAIAEGVETFYQLTQLKNLGCDEAQGYFFSRPISAKNAETFLCSEFDRILDNGRLAIACS